MGKRVLVAVDLHSASEASIVYGIELAARIESSAILIAISSPRPPKKSNASEASHQYANSGRDLWSNRAVAESQKRGVTLEIYVTSGRFFQEIIRFVRSQPAIQFIVMAAPKDGQTRNGSRFASALKQLHREFEGEILLVERAGQITRVSDLYLQSSAQE